MFNIINKSTKWNGKTIKLETGKIARQADASVLVKMGGSAVLCTVTYSKELKENIDFFPLTVNYLEKYYAAGRFPGGFFKREGKPSDRETLVSRLIDRPIRPLFPEDFFHEVSVICKVLSYDSDAPTDILAIIGTATALKISELPFTETLGAVKIGLIDDEFVINPSLIDLERSGLDLTIAGTEDSVLMIESAAKEISEEKMTSAIEFGHKSIQPIIKLINDFATEAGKSKYEYAKLSISDMYQVLRDELEESIKDVYQTVNKKERNEKLKKAYNDTLKKYSGNEGFEKNVYDIAFKKLQNCIVRNKILNDNTRIDGRKLDEIRNIECEIGLLDAPHGSALFTRGETQALAIVTLGSMQDAQLKDDITGVSSDKFLLHYNFPPYSVGEVGMLKPPGRREIGHGKLAYKAVLPILPSDDKFPYTIRVVSEITESNGSSSMATVCASTLALMDTGVPIKTPVAGIAMGLILEDKNKFAILSDILGDEDALGDMDFKVTSTKNGITALQMDIKVGGITIEIIKQAISQAQKGCNHILNEMLSVISQPKGDLSASAPRVVSMTIDKDKIRDIIGPGGKIIKDICEKSGAKIDIEDDGKISIFANDEKSLMIAKGMIEELVSIPEIGKIYNAKIIKIMPFGAFVKFLGNFEGLLHISEISDRNINNLGDILSENTDITVKYLGTDNRGKNKLTIKDIKQSDEFYNKDAWKNLMQNPPKNQVGKKAKDYNADNKQNNKEKRQNDNFIVDKKNTEGEKSELQKAKRFINKVLEDF